MKQWWYHILWRVVWEPNDYRVKMGSKTKTYHVNKVKKYIASESEVDVVHTSNKDDATIAVIIVIY